MSFKKRNCPIPPCPKGSSEQGILGRYYESISKEKEAIEEFFKD